MVSFIQLGSLHLLWGRVWWCFRSYLCRNVDNFIVFPNFVKTRNELTNEDLFDTTSSANCHISVTYRLTVVRTIITALFRFLDHGLYRIVGNISKAEISMNPRQPHNLWSFIQNNYNAGTQIVSRRFILLHWLQTHPLFIIKSHLWSTIPWKNEKEKNAAYP